MSGHKSRFAILYNSMGSTYWKYIAQGRCGQCGKPNDREDRAVCSECAKKDVEIHTQNRIWYREHGICPRCGKNILMGQEKSCVECRAKDAEAKAKERERNPEKAREAVRKCQNKAYEERKEQGLCPHCGKKNPDKRFITCPMCRAKARDRHSPKTLREEREKAGLCIWCNNPVKVGYKICEKHYQMNCEKAKKSDRSIVMSQINSCFINK